MIMVYVDDNSATLWIEAEFMNNKVFYTTYKDGTFYCQPGNLNTFGKPFFINGLDEVNILDRALKAAHHSKYKDSKMVVGGAKVPVVSNYDPKQFFKGTTFGGVTENAFGYIAALLKEGLKDFEVHIGVKLKWTAGDLLKYINAIQQRAELNVQLA